MLWSIFSFLILTQFHMLLSIIPYAVIFLFGLPFHWKLEDWIIKLKTLSNTQIGILFSITEIVTLGILILIAGWWYQKMNLPYKEVCIILLVVEEASAFYFKFKKAKEFIKNGSIDDEEIENPIYK